MSLKARITDDMKAAMRARESARLGTIRLLLAALKQKEVDERTELDDAAIAAVVERLIKQRKDAISQFEAAGRADLVTAEQTELAVLEVYLPERLSPDEIETAIAAAIAETGAATPKDMGKVMGLLKPRLAGRADMGQVSASIKARLAG